MRTPKLAHCFGFKFSNFSLNISKNYLQIDVNYKEVEKVKDPAYCENFEETLLTMPTHLMKKYFDFDLYKALSANMRKKKMLTDSGKEETSKG
jgi:hypothetical protein